jgi:protoheme ferro-lyase
VPAPSGSAPPSVVVLASGQPEHYDPAITTESFGRMAASGMALPPEAIRVFAYTADRARYRSAGINPARPVARAVTRRAAEILEEAGFDGEVHEAWLHGTPRLRDAVAEASARGSTGVAVVLLDVAESYKYDLARREAAPAPGDEGRPDIAYAPPLWGNEELARTVHAKIRRALPGGPRRSDGVALVASGQPPEWDRSHPQAAEHETFFCQRVRSLLVADGFAEGHVRLAWLDWRDPDVTDVVRHLAAAGCQRIAVVPTTTPADSLDTALELPAAVRQAAVEDPVKIEVLHGWGEEEEVAQVVAAAARRALEELGWKPGCRPRQ